MGLLLADIITDFIAADEFFQRGDTYWGSFTLIPVFAPLGVRVIMLAYSFCRCLQIRSEKEKLNKIKYVQWIQEAQQLPWHIPLLQPIRFAKYLSSGFGLEIMLTPGQTRGIGESETKGKGAKEGGSNLMR